MISDKKTYTAQTVDDAITNATLDLGVPSSELGYEVIDKGSKGFLGKFCTDLVFSTYSLVRLFILLNRFP